ncbi:MAG TPA: FtsX-like permease family protein [Natronosporangium sp.]
MQVAGLPVPPATPVLDPATVLIGMAVGAGATLLASLAPAVRAARVPPLAALRDLAVDRPAGSRFRHAAGAVLTAGGVAATIAGTVGAALPATGAGALATVAGVLLLGPVLVRAVAVTPGTGVTGVLARRNAVRNPRRTAGTAASLTIGAAMVVLFTVIAGSLQQSIAGAIDRQFAGDLVISGEGRGGFSTELAPAVNALPEVAAATPIGGAAVRVDGTDLLASTIDPATIETVVDLDLRQGSLARLGPDQLAVSTGYAEQRGLRLGDRLTVTYPDGTTQRPAIGAIYGNDQLVGGGGVALSRDAYLPHTTRRVDVTMLIALAPGVPEPAGEAAVQRVADRFGAPDVQTNQEFADTIAGEINVLLTVVYLLLSIAIVIAVMGIANTLSLSAHERTRELGLLRAVGQTRRQVRAMVRYEALIVALSGTVIGLGLGLFLGWALLPVLSVDGFTPSFALRPLPLLVVLLLGGLVGVLAAARPARRAARTDLLAAIATG